MIADMLSNKTPAPIVTELFIRERKLNISLGFILLCCIKKCKTKFYTLFFMKIPSKWELHQITFNHSWDIGFSEFTNLCNKYTVKPCSFLAIDATLAPDNSFYFRKNFLERI